MTFNYNIWFDVCAISLLVCTIILYTLRRSVRIMQNIIFFITMVMMLMASISSLLTIVLEGVSYIWLWISNYSVILCDSVVGSLWIIYILSISTNSVNQKLAAITVFTPLFIAIILLGINIPTGILFTINKETLVYESGPYIYLLYIFVYFHYLLVAMNIFLSNRKYISRERITFLPMILIEGLLGAILEIIFPTLIVQQFALTLMTMTTYMSLKNPNEFYDESSGLMNEEAFYTTYSKVLSDQSRSRSFIAICIHDIDAVIAHINITKKTFLEKNVYAALREYNGKTFVYKFAEGRYLVATNSTNKMQILDLYAICLRAMGHMNISSTCCLFNTPDTVSSVQGIKQLMERTTQEGIARNLSSIAPEELNLHKESYIKTVEELVRTCISNNRLEVYYQPIYSVKDQRFISAEAVIRMKNGREGIISPEVFIPIAEKDGNILDIGYYVLEDVCKTIAEENLEKYGINSIQVNLSVVECIQDDLVRKISHLLKKYRVNPKNLNLQITEEATTYFTEVVKHNIKQLHEMGITFSLDGFGSGYSSLNKIVTLPLKIIKIDRSIVIPAFKTGNESAHVLLERSVDMVKQIGCHVVAEGAETGNIANGLSNMGCDYIQGYYYARPMPKDQFVKFIKR